MCYFCALKSPVALLINTRLNTGSSTDINTCASEQILYMFVVILIKLLLYPGHFEWQGLERGLRPRLVTKRFFDAGISPSVIDQP